MTVAVAAAVVTRREATLADVPTLVEMGQRFRRDTVYAATLRENPAQMAATATQLITSDQGLVIVLERGDVIVGVFGGLVYTHHLSGEPTFGEVFFWVNPEARGHGVRLLRCAEQWARLHGAVTMQMIAPTPDVGRLYERLGYAPLETSYGKEL